MSNLDQPGGDQGRDADALQRADDSIVSLEHGGLPVAAKERMELLASSQGAWTSDLSVAELASLRALGLQPAGLVLGSAVYSLAGQWGSSYWNQGWGGYSSRYPCPHGWHQDARTGFNWEHVLHERGLTAARDLAVDRMEAEAQALGAHGVAGVHLRFGRLEGVFSAIEFTAVGTALVVPGRPPPDRPFTSDLSGQDLAKLLRRGFAPSRLVMGIAAVEVDPGCGTEWAMGSWFNSEVTQFAEGGQACREIAVDHLKREATEAGADSVVGVEVRFSHHELPGEAKLLELLALGTAVRRFSDVPLPDPPLVMLRLNDRPGGTL